jgi:bifunctional non-homologous end joining protein LigD
VVAAVAALPVRTALLDGELVVFGRDGRPDFGLLQARGLGRRGTAAHSPARACAFDLLALNGRDLRRLRLVARKAILEEVLDGQHEVVLVEHVEERGEELLRGACDLGLEGVVAKRADAPYSAGRTTTWRKFKNENTSDFVVTGIGEPSEATYGRSSLLLALVDADRRLRYVGRVAIGASELAALEPLLAALRRATPPCAGVRRALVRLEPAVVCEVRYLASSGRGLRHATFVRFRPDKRWTECVDS